MAKRKRNPRKFHLDEFTTGPRSPMMQSEIDRRIEIYRQQAATVPGDGVGTHVLYTGNPIRFLPPLDVLD